MPKTVDEYLADPVHCPYCGHEDIEGGSPAVFDNVCVSKITCNNCESEWSDIYRLVSYEGQGDDSSGSTIGASD